MLSTQDRFDLMALVNRGFWLIDNGRAGESAALFTDDASLTFGAGAPKPGTISGPDIAAAMRAREGESAVTSRHVLSNTIVAEDGAGAAIVRSLLTLFRTSDTDVAPVVRSVADVIDACVETRDGWKIASRRILPIFYHA